MTIFQRHSRLTVWFYVLLAVIRRALETMRLQYWKTVRGWDIGAKVRVHWSAKLPRTLSVHLKDRACISPNVRIIAEAPGGTLCMGADASVSQHATLDVSGELIIGERVVISDSAMIYTHSHGQDPRSKPRMHRLEIGNDVWVCARAMVLSSARKVPDGTIVPANSVWKSPPK